MDDLIKSTAYLAEVEIDNTRGSSRFCTLTNINNTECKPVQIEFTPNNGRVEINGTELTNDQRKLLIKFLKQKDNRI